MSILIGLVVGLSLLLCPLTIGILLFAFFPYIHVEIDLTQLVE